MAEVKCWGSNDYGQLGQGISSATVGTGSATWADNLPALNLGTGFTPVALALGYSHSCALSSQGGGEVLGSKRGRPTGARRYGEPGTEPKRYGR